ncbi:uncharacterized protein EAE97_001303 [Botrytis byssoidea]|uniref:YDG domain-containing protein n=1 Tax=Botrytis byssoidea TaxID=139641 RepID=A0A9P5M8F6_9HELO|nr:uncharacterized protein EAE97_001303 [Botrytis byssoidea]KAF7953905.1 hypothetical protein EAE97_001303 [Botrytis byssoidea]
MAGEGIGGKASVEVVSIILGSGGGKNEGYENIQKGDKFGYWGDDTDLMDLSFEKNVWILAIRGAHSDSVHAPPVFFRYVGLYKITGKFSIAEKAEKYSYELARVEKQKSTKKLHPIDEEIDEF